MAGISQRKDNFRVPEFGIDNTFSKSWIELLMAGFCLTSVSPFLAANAFVAHVAIKFLTCPTLGAGVSRASGSCPRAYAVVASVRTKHLSGTDAARTRRKIRRQSVEGRRVPYHGHRHSQKEKTKNGPHFDLLARIYTVVVLNVFGFEHQIKQP